MSLGSPPAPLAPPAADDAEPAPAADRSGRPDPNVALQDRLPEWFRTTPAAPILTLPLGLIFLIVGSLSLWHTDLWGHLAYGRLIWETKSIPATEPFMPLARGVELVDTAWLSQVVGHLMLTWFGPAGLQFLAAFAFTSAAAAVAWAVYHKCGRVAWTCLGIAAFVWLNGSQLFSGDWRSVLIRPQLAGMALFAVTLAVAVGRPSRAHWYIVPAAFALWANLHGSFLAGLTLLAAFAVGRGCDVLRRTDSFGAVVRDWPFWRLILLTELAAVAVLLNPYGLRIYPEAILLAGNDNLRDLIEWQPLTLRMRQGQAAAAVAFTLIVLYRLTPRRVGTGEALALIGFGGLSLWTSRMIVWWAPLAAYGLAVHGAAVWDAHRLRAAKRRGTAESESEDEPTLPARRSLWTVTAIGLAWIFFGLTPFAQRLLHGRDPQAESRAIARQTPVGAARHLAEQPPAGQVFNTYELGDYLLYADPGLPVFVASHAHLVPKNVWRDYVDGIGGASGWETMLDRYGVDTLVLDRPARQAFIDRLKDEPRWERTYQDNAAAVFRRRTAPATEGH